MLPRLWLLAVIWSLLWVGFLFRLFQLQVVQGERLDNRIQADRLVEELLPARRGRMLDQQGRVLVDNRAVYHIGVELDALQVPPNQRRRWQFRVCDEEARGRLSAAAAGVLGRPAQELLRSLEEELAASPGVALRLQEQDRSDIGLVALPTPPESDTAPAAKDPLLPWPSPSAALQTELSLRWEVEALVCPQSAWLNALGQLDQDLTCGRGFCAGIFEAFVLQLEVELPDAQRVMLSVLTPSRQRAGEASLARAVGLERSDLHQLLEAVLAPLRQMPAEPGPWRFAPASLGDHLASMLVDQGPLVSCTIRGAPPGHERIYYIQADPSGAGDGLLSLFARRLRAAWGAQGDWVQALLEQELAQDSASNLLRRWNPQHLLVFDAAKVGRFCEQLSRRASAAGLARTPLDIERAITTARRHADRAWAGATAYDAVPLISDVDKRVALALAPQGGQLPGKPWNTDFELKEPDLPGLRILTDLGREYRYPGLASHVIGRLGRLSATWTRGEALAMGLDPEGWRGASGLELLFDGRLQGVTGRRLRLISPEGIQERLDPPIAGQDLRLTLNMDVQRVAEYALEHWFDLALELHPPEVTERKMRNSQSIGLGRAGLVLMDVHTGHIRAMASHPAARPEDIRAQFRELAADPGQPLLDHSATASQPPGSGIKILVGMAAMATGYYKPGQIIKSEGKIGSMGDHAPPGDYDLQRAIAKSSNVVFAKLALDIGPDELCRWFDRFGLGRRLSPDVNWQQPARAITPENIVRVRPSEPYWTNGDTRRLGIGQFWASSPLEMISIPAAVANKGLILAPTLVERPDFDPVRDRILLGEQQWRVMREGMEATVEDGTARHLILSGAAEGIRVAAKTGTSEWGNRASRASGKTPDHAWLIGYAPADNPEVAFAVFVHSGTSGGWACTGIIKAVLEAWFGRTTP